MARFETNGRSSESEVGASCIDATAVPRTSAAQRIVAQMLLRMDSPFRLNGITRDEICVRSVRRQNETLSKTAWHSSVSLWLATARPICTDEPIAIVTVPTNCHDAPSLD